MSSYKNNKDGTLTSIATNNHISQGLPQEGFITEGELVEAKTELYKYNGEMGAKNLIPFPYYSGWKEPIVRYTITFTVNKDTSITCQATSVSSVYVQFILVQDTWIKEGDYILSVPTQLPNGVNIELLDVDNNNATVVRLGGSATIKKQFTINSTLAQHNLRLQLNLANNYTYDTTIYPMIRLASDIDDTWYPCCFNNVDSTYFINQCIGNMDIVDWTKSNHVTFFGNTTSVNAKINCIFDRLKATFRFPTLSFDTPTATYGLLTYSIKDLLNDIDRLRITILNHNFVNTTNSYYIDKLALSSGQYAWTNAIQLLSPTRINQNGDNLIDISTIYRDNKETIDSWDNVFLLIAYNMNISTTIIPATDISVSVHYYYPDADNTNAKSIVCWGDSLTAQGGWTTKLSELSGLLVYNGGTGGEGVHTIMARQGGDIMMTNNITIPADTTAITIATKADNNGINTQFGYKSQPLLQGGSNHVNPVKIGDVLGTLTWTGSSYSDPNGTWTFARNVAGNAVTIDRPTSIRTAYDRLRNTSDNIMIIFMGQNGGYTDNADLVHMHKLMIDHFQGKEYVVLGLSSGTSTSRADYEAAMTEAFGRRFISLRQYLAHPIYDGNNNIVSCYGLADQGLTPTADDLDKIAVGQVPAQCLKDGVHYTTGTQEVIGNMLYKKMCELNIL